MNNEIYVPAVPNSILVFDRNANGDVPPKRLLTSVTGSVGVDPIHNLVMVNAGRSMLIFDRTASGDAKPKATISGPKSGMGRTNTFQVYAPTGWIIAGGSDESGKPTSFGGDWSISDNGEVPPRWKIPVQRLTGYGPYSLALDPLHKEDDNGLGRGEWENPSNPQSYEHRHHVLVAGNLLGAGRNSGNTWWWWRWRKKRRRPAALGRSGQTPWLCLKIWFARTACWLYRKWDSWMLSAMSADAGPEQAITLGGEVEHLNPLPPATSAPGATEYRCGIFRQNKLLLQRGQSLFQMPERGFQLFPPARVFRGFQIAEHSLAG